MRPTPVASAYASQARGTMELLGWTYPAEFSDPAEEHRRVRTAAGLFDFSFMGHFLVRGPEALAFVQRIVANDAGRLAPGTALYSPICSESGMLVDDCTVICRGTDAYLITCGLESSFGWLERHQPAFRVWLEDESRRLSTIAVQGPLSLEILADLGLSPLRALSYFRAVECSLRGVPTLVARIGYTGELGYELLVPADCAADVWHWLLAAGRPAGLEPCGGRALESLRIEAGYLMTQVDFDDRITPMEAGLSRFVRLDKGEFIGRQALAAMGEPERRLCGLRLPPMRGEGKGVGAGVETVVECGAAVRNSTGRVVGRVTSACLSPTLGGQLALAYLGREAGGSSPLAIDGVPGAAVRASLPFYDPSRRRVRTVPSSLPR